MAQPVAEQMAAANDSTLTNSTIKEDYLLVKSKSRLRSTWRKLWCRLCKQPGAGLGGVQLSQFKTPQDAAQDLGCFARIDLSSATAIRLCPEQKKKNSFLIECTSAARVGECRMELQSTTFYFCGTSSSETDEWVDVLQEHAPSAAIGGLKTLRKNLTGSLPSLSELSDQQQERKRRESLSSLDINTIYQPSASTYLVEFDGSELVPFKGQCTLTLTADTITLSHGKQPVAVAASNSEVLWPVRSIRKYGIRDQLFYFDSGRSCSTGPGCFTFRTDNETAEQLLAKLRFISRMLASQKSTESSADSSPTEPGNWLADTVQTRQHIGIASSTSSTPVMLRRSTSDNTLLSEDPQVVKFDLEDDDNTGPYSVTRIRNSWIALSRALNKSQPGVVVRGVSNDGDSINGGDSGEDDTRDLTDLHVGESRIHSQQVMMRSKSAHAVPVKIGNPLQTDGSPPLPPRNPSSSKSSSGLGHQYETVSRGPPRSGSSNSAKPIPLVEASYATAMRSKKTVQSNKISGGDSPPVKPRIVAGYTEVMVSKAVRSPKISSEDPPAPSVEVSYSKVLPSKKAKSPKTSTGEGPATSRPCASAGDLPLHISVEQPATSLDGCAEASAQAALKRRYSPIFLPSRSPRSSLPPTPSRASPSFPGTPYVTSPQQSPPGQGSLLSSPTSVRSYLSDTSRTPSVGSANRSSLSSPTSVRSYLSDTSRTTSVGSANSSGSTSEVLALATTSPSVGSPNSVEYMQTSVTTATNQHVADSEGYMHLKDKTHKHAEDYYRRRSSSEPDHNPHRVEYDHLDHDSKRVTDGYARLAHSPPDRPPKPLSDEPCGYSNLLPPVRARHKKPSPDGGESPGGRALTRRFATRVSTGLRTRCRVRAQSDGHQNLKKNANIYSNHMDLRPPVLAKGAATAAAAAAAAAARKRPINAVYCP